MTQLASNPAVLACGFGGLAAAYWLLWAWPAPKKDHQRRHHLCAWIAPCGEHTVLIVTAEASATVVNLPPAPLNATSPTHGPPASTDPLVGAPRDGSVDELERLWQVSATTEPRRTGVAPPGWPRPLSSAAISP
jgi:hypothetical protein